MTRDANDTAQVPDAPDALATAEAQRDEALHRLEEAQGRLSAERLLAAAGVSDVEAAATLLARRVDLAQTQGEELRLGVEQLLLDKPYLRSGQVSLPPPTASGRAPAAAAIIEAAQRAARSGDRRDVAHYLRLRRASRGKA
jgi:hypothetical protein